MIQTNYYVVSNQTRLRFKKQRFLAAMHLQSNRTEWTFGGKCAAILWQEQMGIGPEQYLRCTNSALADVSLRNYVVGIHKAFLGSTITSPTISRDLIASAYCTIIARLASPMRCRSAAEVVFSIL
jgi:hypothetical protein